MVGIPSVEMVILGMVYGIGFSTLWSPIPLIAIHKPWFTIRSHSLLSTIIPVTILQPLTTIFTINYSSLITIVINHCFSLTKTQPRHVTNIPWDPSRSVVLQCTWPKKDAINYASGKWPIEIDGFPMKNCYLWMIPTGYFIHSHGKSQP